MLDAGGPVIFSSVGIKRRFFVGFFADLDTTQANFKDRAAWPTAALVRAARNPSVSSKVTQPVGKTLNTATPILQPGGRGGHINAKRCVHGWRAAPVHIRHGVIFYSMSNTRLNTRVIGLVCKAAVLTSGQSVACYVSCCHLPFIIKGFPFTRATVTFLEPHDLSTFL